MSNMNNLKVEYRRTAELVPYAGNARTHSEQQVEQIVSSIRTFGFYNPVLIDERGTIIAGHGRVMAASQMGLEKVPTITLEGLNENERRALVLADNKISLNASWDFEKVREELSALALEDFSLELTGFNDDEISALLESGGDLIPYDASSHYVGVVPQSERQAQQPHVPGVSDDDYSRFDLVMLHTNKAELVELLSQRRTEMMYEKLEDALMDLVKYWKENH
jgi:hypothetical protein